MKALRRLIISLLLFQGLSFVGMAQETMSLETKDGIQWYIKAQSEMPSESGCDISEPNFAMNDAVEGCVPGTVFGAYVKAGKENDPTYSDNIYKVDEKYYNQAFWYRTTFVLPSSYKTGQRVWLNFENTNRYADFYFNGVKLSGTSNTMRDVKGHMLRSKYDVTSYLNQNGKNCIAVLIYDADTKKSRNSNDVFGVASPTYMSGAGWDWMPYIPGRLAGITGHAYVSFSSDVTIVDPWIRTDLPTLDRGEISVMTELKNSSSSAKKVTLKGEIEPGNISFSKEIEIGANTTADIKLGKEEFGQLVVNNPKLWWPNGYGDPDLYTCKLECAVSGEVSDAKTITFGIRKYGYEMVKNVAGEDVLTLSINGKKLYVKGGNWGISEYLLQCQNEEYEKRILLHKDMNYNMIRLWTGCVTDEEFYDYCDKHGMMVWDDFWLYVMYFGVSELNTFKQNALDKIKRLRNHASIAVWCGANETTPQREIDEYLKEIVQDYDNNDRLYQPCSNKGGLSGSGWWGNKTPKSYFESAANAMVFNNPPYPFGPNSGYGMRTELGTATFPTYESVKEFMPESAMWPLPTDDQIKNDDSTIWNRHFFGKEAINANPIDYKNAVNTQFGESNGIEEFCEKSQLLNIDVMRGMYEAWNDKMWNDASGILIWMSNPAYPAFVWQTYDYYMDATGSYWGAKKACEPLHIQWNALTNSVKVINTTSDSKSAMTATASIYNLRGQELKEIGNEMVLDVPSNSATEAFTLTFSSKENLAKNKSVVASSFAEDNFKPENVNDGNDNTRWSSTYFGEDDAWIYVDLGKTQKVASVILKWESAYGREYDIMVSEDARTWKSVYTQNNGMGNTEVLNFPVVDARYVKMQGRSRATMWGYSLYEFEVYGELAGGDELTPLHFIKLKLADAKGQVKSENLYFRNGVVDYNYTDLNTLPSTDVSVDVTNLDSENGKITLLVKNNSETVSVANRIRFVEAGTNKRLLPLLMSDNYITLMPKEQKTVTVEVLDKEQLQKAFKVLLKTYGSKEQEVFNSSGIESVTTDKEQKICKIYGLNGAIVIEPNSAVNVDIYNVSGVKVRSLSRISGVVSESISNGIYIVRACDGNRTMTEKIAVR